MFETKKVWYIECMTGCTCCAGDNFDQGFYDNTEEPKAIIERWSKGDGNPPLLLSLPNMVDIIYMSVKLKSFLMDVGSSKELFLMLMKCPIFQG